MQATRLRKTGAVLLAVLGGVWATGLTVVLRKRAGVSFDFPVLKAHPAALHNLALYQFGTRVRASSYDHWSDSQHHPAFLVDGLNKETIDQKWATQSKDKRPWVELYWKQPATLEQIRIRHAGTNEERAYTARAYRMTCLTAAGPATTLEITDNTLPTTSHDLKCAAATGVRLDFWPNRLGDPVRVFEVEAWGTPENSR